MTFQHHQKVFVGFLLYSLTLGAALSRLADLQSSMAVGKGALGFGLLGAALGTQITLIFGGKLVGQLGLARTMLVGVPILGLAQIGATLAPGIPAFFTSLLVSGLAIGAMEIVLNLEADRAEHHIGRRLMSRAHAFWSFGFFGSGMIGAAAAEVGLPPWLHLLLLDTATAVLTFVLLRTMTPLPARPGDDGARPGFVLPSIGILALVAYTLSAMLLEGAGIDWSVIFMRDTFDETPFVDGLAFAFGALSQGVVRYFADPFIDRHGPERVGRTLLMVLLVGCLCVTFALNPLMALAGFLLMGIGTSAVFPLAMSAAARRTDRPAAANVAALAQMSFIVFLIAPPVLGLIAETFGVRTSFGIGLPLIALSWFFLRELRPKS